MANVQTTMRYFGSALVSILTGDWRASECSPADNFHPARLLPLPCCRQRSDLHLWSVFPTSAQRLEHGYLSICLVSLCLDQRGACVGPLTFRIEQLQEIV